MDVNTYVESVDKKAIQGRKIRRGEKLQDLGAEDDERDEEVDEEDDDEGTQQYETAARDAEESDIEDDVPLLDIPDARYPGFDDDNDSEDAEFNNNVSHQVEQIVEQLNDRPSSPLSR